MLDYFRQRRLVLLLLSLAAGAAMTAHADSSSTTQGLAAFSGGRYAEALEYWQRAAKAGDGQAALYVGLMNDLGRGVAQDPKAARAWYERAAALGNAVAMFNLGVLYDSGIGVPRDHVVAADWYGKAAAKGIGRAAYALGLMYEAGDGVANDKDQAVRYFRQALTSGITAARAHLASLGDANGKVKHDKNAGREAARDTGMGEFDRAQELLLRRTPEAVQEATALLRQAADKGNLLAAYNLAYCYQNGIGMEVDQQQAYIWYSRAARSPTITVRRAALAAIEALAPNLTPSELPEPKSAVEASRPEPR
jgi:TPR repeat protein